MKYSIFNSGTIKKRSANLKKDYTKEGLHLTDLGYFKVTSSLSKYIDEEL